MDTQLFDYVLPDHLIAQTPADKRDESRLMVVNRLTQTISHHVFRDIGQFLDSNTVLIVNNTEVFNARLKGHKSTGAAIEVFLLEQRSATQWTCLAKPAKRLRKHDEIIFSDYLSATVIEKNKHLLLDFNFSGDFYEHLNRDGEVPLPPYIKAQDPANFQQRYQTVYASERGSVAAPTAGLHFTPILLDQLRSQGVLVEEITLHVGYGTFKPIDTPSLHDHEMHEERFRIKAETAKRLNQYRLEGKRIIAVGTTSTRALESAASSSGDLSFGDQVSNLFISPGYRFNFVQSMITNFHLPKSSLLVLISAFASIELIQRAYQEAIDRQYRFYSFGDAMLIL